MRSFRRPGGLAGAGGAIPDPMLLTLRPRSPCRAAKRGARIGAADPAGTRSLAANEEDRGDHQAVQTRRGEGGAAGGGNPGHHRPRSERLRPAKGPYRALSGGRVRRRLSAQGEDRGRRLGRKSPSGDRGDPQRGADGPHRRWQDICIADRGSHPHPHRGDRRGRGLKAFQADEGARPSVAGEAEV